MNKYTDLRFEDHIGPNTNVSRHTLVLAEGNMGRMSTLNFVH
jgi:hypothetical protein